MLSYQRLAASECRQDADHQYSTKNTILFKMLLGYSQMVAIVLTLPIEEKIDESVEINDFTRLQRWLVKLVHTLKYSDSTSTTGFSWDCLIRSLPWVDNVLGFLVWGIFGVDAIGYDTPWSNFVFEIYFLLLGVAISSYYWFIRRRSTLSRQVKKAMLLGTSVILLFTILPNLQLYVMNLTDCSNIGTKANPMFHLKSLYDISCNSFDYKWMIWVLVLPAGLLYSFIIPLTIIFFIQRAHQISELDDSFTIMRFGFLYLGYKPDLYFWEMLITMRKFIMILFIVFLARYSFQLQILSVLIVMQVAFALKISWKPYVDDELNQLERLSLISSLVMSISGLYFVLYADTGNAESYATAYLINAIVVILSIAVFLRAWFKSYKAVLRKIVLSSNMIWITRLVHQLLGIPRRAIDQTETLSRNQ
eukprot:TRINITY_DN8835_c0_g1_i3.p1 TRINITY_DN8835_c0_g1~~TRINITY_DN8835_c0_g1_i3.p1  ORF type:complete len:420 (-),score=9.49 TRINITY_DN8835_c0_g1_i3:167-1426(-)